MQDAEYFRMAKEKFGSVFGEVPTDLIAYVGSIGEEGCKLLHDAVGEPAARAKQAVVWITTTGGDANAAYRMSSCLLRNYKRVICYVSTVCKSAGTLMAIGAHEIVMADDAELGPLDIQIQKRDELWEYGSGLDSLEALDVLKLRSMAAFRDHVMEMRMNGIPTKIASEVAKSLTLGILAPIAGHLDPVSLGETNRRLRIAEEYSRRLDKITDNLKSYDEALAQLLTGYPSHGFVINREEASTLFNRVRPPNAEEKSLFRHLAETLPVGRKKAGGEPRVVNVTKRLNKIVVEDATEGSDGNVADAGEDEKQRPAVEPRSGLAENEQKGGGNGSAA